MGLFVTKNQGYQKIELVQYFVWQVASSGKKVFVIKSFPFYKESPWSTYVYAKPFANILSIQQERTPGHQGKYGLRFQPFRYSSIAGLFPLPKAKRSVYYVVRVFAGKAEKHAKRFAKGSDRHLCLSYSAGAHFFEEKKGGRMVLTLTNDSSIQTDMVGKSEMLGGLYYANCTYATSFKICEI